MASTPSKILCGFRALGFVSNHVPLITRYHKRHKDNYVITCVGQAFHVYNVSKLGIVSVSDFHPEDISVLASDALYIFTSSGKEVYGLVRNKKIEKHYMGHKADVQFLLPFGHHLISIDVDGFLIVWDIRSQQKYLELHFDPATFSVSAIGHPHTYMNKVLVGSQEGALQLWNIRTGRLVFSFKGWDSPVTSLQQSTAVDVMAIGLADGHIYLHNLALDKTVVKFKQDYGPVTTISFRTDGHPIMVSGSTPGHIALWDLENRKLHSYLKDAHYASVTGLSCLPSEPLMVTSAADNSLKVWIFDLPDGGARLLRSREGHSAPPTCARFYGADGHTILTTGQDSTMRSFSTIHDKHNKSLGRASFYKKVSKRVGLKMDKHRMPPIVKFCAEWSRASDWDNVVACHRSLCQVTTWSTQRSTMGQYTLQHPRFSQGKEEVVATAVDISSCGNFTVIGYSSGHVDMYNLQSGLHRGTFGDPTAHACTVRGVAIDGLNQKLISAGVDKLLRFWKFKTKLLLGEISMEAYISQILLHRDSSMLAVALDDFTINLVDIDSRRTVRHFCGHTSAISDMTFRLDSRWLISASMDCSVRTWNIPTGKLIDAFLVRSAVTSLSMSPCGNFVVTTHVGDVGVYLWSNRTLYTHVSLIPLPENFVPKLVDLPGTAITDSASSESGEEASEEGVYKSPDQIGDELVTLSLLPTSRWLNLLNLDVIKQRNKPKEAPKAPKAAPFFIPTIAGLETKFDLPKDTEASESSSHIKRPALGSLSDLAEALTKAHKHQDYIPVLEKLKALGPSAIDMELRSLCEGEGGSNEVMYYFLEFIQSVLKSNKDFELAHSYLALFLKVHGEEVSSKATLSHSLSELEEDQSFSWNRLQTQLHRAIGLVTYLRSATL